MPRKHNFSYDHQDDHGYIPLSKRTTGFNWVIWNSQIEDQLYKILKDFRNDDPRFTFVTTDTYLGPRYVNVNSSSTTGSRKYFNSREETEKDLPKYNDHSVFDFADVVSYYICSKYEEAYKQIFNHYNSVEQFNKSKESKGATYFLNGYENGSNRYHIYRAVMENISRHYV